MKTIFRSALIIIVIAVIGWSVNRYSGLPKSREMFDDSAYQLENKVGLFTRRNDNAELLITWDTQRGLRVVDVRNAADEKFVSWRLIPESNSEFRILRDGSREAAIVKFEFDSSGKASEYVRTSADGRTISAIRTPNEDYSQQLVTFQNGDVTIEATVLVPSQPLNIGAVIIHGSGYSDRNNAWATLQADYLARQGITVLFPDKRGSGKSQGVWEHASLIDFAEDAASGARALENLFEGMSNRIGFIGLSLGGRITPIAAAKHKKSAFVVSVVSGFTTLNEALYFQLINDWKNNGLPDGVARTAAYLDSFLVRDRRPTYWRKNGKFDVTPYWRDLSVPGLAIFGMLDEQANVPVRMSLEILKGINANRETEIDVKVYDDMGHALFDPQTKWISYEYLTFLVDWIIAKTGTTEGSVVD